MQITIPFSVTSIGEDAFKGCSSLTQITIPASLKREIDIYKFPNIQIIESESQKIPPH